MKLAYAYVLLITLALLLAPAAAQKTKPEKDSPLLEVRYIPPPGGGLINLLDKKVMRSPDLNLYHAFFTSYIVQLDYRLRERRNQFASKLASQTLLILRLEGRKIAVVLRKGGGNGDVTVHQFEISLKVNAQEEVETTFHKLLGLIDKQHLARK